MSIDISQLARAAREASQAIASLTTDEKNRVLLSLAELLVQRAKDVAKANIEDFGVAEEAGLAKAKLYRLAFPEEAALTLADSLRQLVALPDPVGQVTREYGVPSGLHIRKVRAPLGVILMIYESRPGVTIDAFALCFKAGNACILKGGKEAVRSNAILADLARQALRQHDLPPQAITAVSDLPRDDLQELLRQDKFIDLCIPRGGPELIRFVHEHSSIPTVQHFHGVCHIYVHADADPDMAERVCVTAKLAAATCNAVECVLVHRDLASEFLPRLIRAFGRAEVQVRASQRVLSALSEPLHNTKPAEPGDFGREFLDSIVAMDIVDSLDGAIEHIRRHSSNHTEAIITRDTGPGGAADEFCRRVQSSCVLVNASTRFNDGFQLGLGAEIGISTSRVHAYGVMGLEELTTQRWIVTGNGQTR